MAKLGIVIPVRGQLEYLQQCVRSIKKYTTGDYIIVLVDNNDDEGCAKWTKEYCQKNNIQLVVEKYDGINLSKVWNIGIKTALAANAKYVAVINSDVIVYRNWWMEFERMFEHDKENKVWMAVPDYSRLEKPIDFEYKAEQALNNQTYEPCIQQRGWFMVFRAETLDPQTGVGLFDEQFRLWYGDTDMWKRLMEKGKTPAMLHSVMIHHFESKTLNVLGGREEIIAEDEAKYTTKWINKVKVNDSDKIGVTIAIPTMGHIRTELFNQMLSVIAENNEYAISVLTTTGKSFHDYARNCLVEDFLTKTKDEWLIFIDDDTIPPNDFLNLLKNNVSICSGIVFTYVNGNFQPTIYKHMEGNRYEPDHKAKFMSGLLETDSTGGACIAIKREVLEKMQKPYFKFEYDEESRMRTLGEDFYFCRQAKALGYKVYVDTNILCDHMKELSMANVVKTVKLHTKNALLTMDEEKKVLAKKIQAERLAKK